MQIPNGATVKPFEEAELGSLLIGRFGDEAPNFVAIRTELPESVGDATPYLAVLSSWVDNQRFPYLCHPAGNSPKVLDLSTDWSIDVSADMDFQGNPDTSVLVRSGSDFFIRLTRNSGYLNTSNGEVIDVLADFNNVVYWSAFTLHIPQLGTDGAGAEVFRWPFDQE